ncbi:Hly-III-related protein [Akanthomyces lecanii RCEF 1005]|uniref:Hly-III-related protein n=1 Tax=Akanthomyces lecanii RCEF 1005 TaxID=1081108 RepID=A0A168G3W2_CORDF|nr:Hly-III-related protein [Akanthomyces lecanii RCEF 1005]
MYATNRNAPRDAGSGSQTATASLTSPSSRTAARLLLFHEIPTWQQDNNYLLSGYRQNVSRFCNKLDYAGILILMWGAGIPTIYYGFICNPSLQVLYWIMTSSTALCCTIFTLTPSFVTPQFRKWRASFYAGFGLSSIIFVVHGLVIHGWELQKSRMSLVWMGWMATANLVGACIYAARTPERWFPYTFDNFGASHQLLHQAVMIAAWIHFRGLIEVFCNIRSQDNICGTV